MFYNRLNHVVYKHLQPSLLLVNVIHTRNGGQSQLKYIMMYENIQQCKIAEVYMKHKNI